MTPTEVISAICPILDVAISTERKNRQLFTLQDAIFSIQLAIYWFQSAEEDLDKLLEEIREPIARIVSKPPTLIGSEESFDYICKELKKLTDSITKYLEEVPFSPGITNKIQQGNNRLMEAYFTTQLSAKYYEQTRGN